MVTAPFHRRSAGFTLIEILVAIGIIAVLMAILMPALEKVREHAMSVKCASNLNQLGAAMLVYANNNDNHYPRTVYDPDAPISYGTGAAATNPFVPGGPNPNDITAAMFLLVRGGLIQARFFIDPYTDEMQSEADPTTIPGSRSNFTDFKQNLSYSMANPYPSKAAVIAGYQWVHSINGVFALAGDLNPGTLGMNSRTHERRGQNVLFADNHVSWEIGVKCGVESDDIYSNRIGVIEGSPMDVNDSVLLPTDIDLK